MSGPPFEAKLVALIENDARFRKTWNHQRRDLGDQSLSGYDYALLSIAIWHGWSNDELRLLIPAHRRHRGDTSGKAERADYVERTFEAVLRRYSARVIHIVRHGGGIHPVTGRNPYKEMLLAELAELRAT